MNKNEEVLQSLNEDAKEKVYLYFLEKRADFLEEEEDIISFENTLDTWMHGSVFRHNAYGTETYSHLKKELLPPKGVGESSIWDIFLFCLKKENFESRDEVLKNLPDIGKYMFHGFWEGTWGNSTTAIKKKSYSSRWSPQKFKTVISYIISTDEDSLVYLRKSFHDIESTLFGIEVKIPFLRKEGISRDYITEKLNNLKEEVSRIEHKIGQSDHV